MSPRASVCAVCCDYLFRQCSLHWRGGHGEHSVGTVQSCCIHGAAIATANGIFRYNLLPSPPQTVLHISVSADSAAQITHSGALFASVYKTTIIHRTSVNARARARARSLSLWSVKIFHHFLDGFVEHFLIYLRLAVVVLMRSAPSMSRFNAFLHPPPLWCFFPLPLPLCLLPPFLSEAAML